MCRVIGHLDFPNLSCRVHPAGHVHCVAPNVIDRLPGTNNTAHQRPTADADPQLECIEGVLVHLLQLLTHRNGKLNDIADTVLIRSATLQLYKGGEIEGVIMYQGV